MRDFLREHAWPVVVSVLLHGLLVGGMLLVTYLSSRQHPLTVQPLPIDAVVLDSRVVHAAQRAKDERAEQEARERAEAEAKAAAEAQATADARAAEEAKATAAEQAAKQDAAEAEARANAANQAKVDKAAEAAEAARVAAAEQQQKAEQQKAEQQKAEQAQRRVEADREAAAMQAALDARRAADARKAAEEARLAAEGKQAAEAKQAADAKAAADAKRAADERAKQDREAELRRQLAEEEHASAVASGPLRDRYITLLRNKIQDAWIKPSSATAGVDCLVQVTQVPGGEVTGARVTQCNGDAAVRQSIENAVYRASPLPDPPDPALFERNLSLRFRPNE
jgi:colicin import membrane protein